MGLKGPWHCILCHPCGHIDWGDDQLLLNPDVE